MRAFAIALLLAGASHATVANEQIRVAGLESPAEIRIDATGVAHLYAASQDDVFFVQGFNAARDRLWQMDLWRRRGLGELAEVLGPAYVAQDRAARLFLFRGDLYREWLAYASDAKRITERFVAGINAYIHLIEREGARLPPEFALLGYAPARWRAEDVVRIRSHGLWRNVTSEVERARIFCRFGPAVDRLRRRLEPAWSPAIPEGIDLCAIPEGVLETYRLATAPVDFGAERSALARNAMTGNLDEVGSNNWAIAPGRTATGRPVLANDPHRAHSVPSLRYAVHLSAPGLDVIGAGEPVLPGISIGHNGRIAFGLTIFGLDHEDLYVYETDAAGTSYRYRGHFEPFEQVDTVISVAGAAAVTSRLTYSRHGPVVFLDPGGRRAYAVRAAWLEPGMAPYFGSIEYMRAGNWQEFLAALNRWGAPAENQVYADVDGNIGRKSVGLFPRRVDFDGLLPVPGDGRYEWQGFFDMDALPVEFNPERGYVATANAMNLPADYPIASRRVGFEWTAPWRQRRIDAVLSAQPRHTLADSLALQRDYGSTFAEAVVAALAGVDLPGAALLRDWDGQLGPDSAAAAFFVVWYEAHLAPALLERFAPNDAIPLIGRLDSQTAVELVGRRDATDLLRRTLETAWLDVTERLGDDVSRWRWGSLHVMRFRHPLAPRTSGTLHAQFALPERERGGSADTPNNTSHRGTNFDVVSGASWRVVIDVGNWDAARMTNAPGQSGDPRSPFYRDLLDGWARDESFPLLYSRAAVVAATVAQIHLEPQ